jgi:hypothetical protein
LTKKIAASLDFFCFSSLNLTNFAISLPKICQIFNVKKLKENKKKSPSCRGADHCFQFSNILKFPIKMLKPMLGGYPKNVDILIEYDFGYHL